VSRTRIAMGIAFAVVAVAGALAVLLVAWERGGDDESRAAIESPEAIAAQGILTPRTVLFGDTVRARVDVLLDRARVDPDSVRVSAQFAPWEVVAEPERVRRNAGSTTYVQTTFVLRCLTSPCVPPGQTAPLEFGPARVTYRSPAGGEQQRESIRVDWPVLTVYSRFASASFDGRTGAATPWRADLLTMPGVSYRVAPGVALVALIAGALLLAVAGALLAVLAWPRRAPAPPPEPEVMPAPVLSPLEQALALLEDTARADGAEDRRRALELVAEELVERDAEIARSARVLAWSEDVPAADETSGLAARVRSAIEEEEAEEEKEEGRAV